MDPAERFLVEEQNAGYGQRPSRSKRSKDPQPSSHPRSIIALYSLWAVTSAVAVAAFAMALTALIQQGNVAPSPVPPVATPASPPQSAPVAVPVSAPVAAPSIAPSPTYPPRIGFSGYLASSIPIAVNTNATLVGSTTSNATYPGYYTTATFDPVLGRYTAPEYGVYLITLYIEVNIGPAVGNIYTTFTCYIDVSGVQTLFAQDGVNLTNNESGQYMLIASTPLSLNPGNSIGVLCGSSTLPATLQGNPNTRCGIEKMAT